jgi:cell division protein FtsB
VSDQFLEHHASSVQPVWVSLNRVLAAVIVLLVVMTLAIRYLPETSRRNEMLAQIQDLESKLAERKGVLMRHEREEKLLRNNSEYLSLIARDRLDLKEEGETLFRFESPKRQQN